HERDRGLLQHIAHERSSLTWQLRKSTLPSHDCDCGFRRLVNRVRNEGKEAIPLGCLELLELGDRGLDRVALETGPWERRPARMAVVGNRPWRLGPIVQAH